MNEKRPVTWGRPLLGLIGILFIMALACQAISPQEPATLPPPPTAGLPETIQPTRPLTPAPATTPGPTPTLAATVLAPTATLESVPAETGASYQVTFVEENDVLNVRTGPGVGNDIAGTLAPGQTGVAITGAGQVVDSALWVPIQAGTVRGWVNSRFLSQTVAGDEFCADSQPPAMLEQLKTAVANRDGQALAQLVALERGLRFRRHWWNPGVRFEDEEVATIFTSEQSYEWGVADGSGLPINGSFSQVMLPLLDRNLLGATEVACNQILHGGTAGLIQLPPQYAGLNYYSLHRSPSESENELDWGTWVVGMERWQGRYYLSFLVHYEWEI